jgi:hypothetical protein
MGNLTKSSFRLFPPLCVVYLFVFSLSLSCKIRLGLTVTYQFDGVELILKLFVFFAGDSVLNPVDVEVFALLLLLLVLLELLKRFFPIAR